LGWRWPRWAWQQPPSSSNDRVIGTLPWFELGPFLRRPARSPLGRGQERHRRDDEDEKRSWPPQPRQEAAEMGHLPLHLPADVASRNGGSVPRGVRVALSPELQGLAESPPHDPVGDHSSTMLGIDEGGR